MTASLAFATPPKRIDFAHGGLGVLPQLARGLGRPLFVVLGLIMDLEGFKRIIDL